MSSVFSAVQQYPPVLLVDQSVFSIEAFNKVTVHDLHIMKLELPLFTVYYYFIIMSSLVSAKSTLGSSVSRAVTLLPYLPVIKSQYKIVLASASPRRKELLGLMGLSDFEVVVSNFPEDLNMAHFRSPQEYCLSTATQKVRNVAKMLTSRSEPLIIIGADTIVATEDAILEKPRDDVDAARMITMLSGNQHSVHTAVVIYSNKFAPSLSPVGHMADVPEESSIKHSKSFVETTKVTFSRLSEADIEAYVASGEGKDKAGSYGIQGLGGQMVQGVQGCYFNVMGLPINALSKALAELVDQQASLDEN